MEITKWEYHTIQTTEHAIVKKDHLTKLGEEGWEMVTVVALFHANIFYFKRQKTEKVEAVDGD